MTLAIKFDKDFTEMKDTRTFSEIRLWDMNIKLSRCHLGLQDGLMIAKHCVQITFPLFHKKTRPSKTHKRMFVAP